MVGGMYLSALLVVQSDTRALVDPRLHYNVLRARICESFRTHLSTRVALKTSDFKTKQEHEASMAHAQDDAKEQSVSNAIQAWRLAAASLARGFRHKKVIRRVFPAQVTT